MTNRELVMFVATVMAIMFFGLWIAAYMLSNPAWFAWVAGQ